jgi:hypothetical protein
MSGYVKDHKTIIGIVFGAIAIGGLLYLVFRKKSGSGGNGDTATHKNGKGGKEGKKPVIPPIPTPNPVPVQSDCFVSKENSYNCRHLDPANDPHQDIVRCLPYRSDLLDTMCDALDQNDPTCGQEYTQFFNQNCSGHTHINNNTSTCANLNGQDCGILNSAYANNGMVNNVNVKKCYDDATTAFYAPYIRNRERVQITDCANAELPDIPPCGSVQNTSCTNTRYGPVHH